MWFHILSDKVRLLRVCRGLTAQNVADLRAMRHDLCNHLCAISGLAQLGDTTRIRAYISDMLGLLSMNTLLAGTGNPALDAVLSKQLNLSREKGVLLVLHTAPLPTMNLHDCDLVRIVCNLLDYGMEQALTVKDRAREVDFTLSSENGYLLIRSAHPTASGKVCKSLVKRLRKCCSQYGGACQFTMKGGVFRAELYLPIRQAVSAAAL